MKADLLERLIKLRDAADAAYGDGLYAYAVSLSDAAACADADGAGDYRRILDGYLDKGDCKKGAEYLTQEIEKIQREDIEASLNNIERIIVTLKDQDTMRLFETLRKRVQFKLGETK